MPQFHLRFIQLYLHCLLCPVIPIHSHLCVCLQDYIFPALALISSYFTHIYILQRFLYQIIYRNKQGVEGRQPVGYTASSQISASNNSRSDHNKNICKTHYNCIFHQNIYNMHCELCTLKLGNE